MGCMGFPFWGVQVTLAVLLFIGCFQFTQRKCSVTPLYTLDYTKWGVTIHPCCTHQVLYYTPIWTSNAPNMVLWCSVNGALWCALKLVYTTLYMVFTNTHCIVCIALILVYKIYSSNKQCNTLVHDMTLYLLIGEELVVHVRKKMLWTLDTARMMLSICSFFIQLFSTNTNNKAKEKETKTL